MRIKVSQLSRQYFEQFPVWTWVDDFDEEDLVCPVLQTDPLATDVGDLLIKAEFWTSAGLHFEGNLGFAVGDGVYVIEFEVKGKQFGFNLHMTTHMPELVGQSLAELRKTLGDEGAAIFPIRYETKFRFADGHYIAGEFNPLRD